MTLQQFRASLDGAEPIAAPAPLRALWHEARGDWDAAHRIAQDSDSADAAWVHAYLHRKEGDIGNAHYWYRRAGRPPATGALDREWEELVAALLPTVR